MEQILLKKYLTGDASPEEKEQIMIWVKADDKNRLELSAMRKLSDITLWQTEERHQPKKSRKTTFTLYDIISIAAMLLLILGGSLYINQLKQQIPEVIMQTIRVPAGQRVEVLLADGTNVWLNAGSTFTFPNHYLSEKREVLLDGEGYFSVKKQDNIPFIVKTPVYDITVLGTEFNVMAYERSSIFEVSLISGLVQVSSTATHERLQLNPNQRAYREKDVLKTGRIEHFEALLWKDGIICFDDEPVDRMVTKLELYFDTKIIIQNEAFKKRKYTGKFRTKDGIEHILRVFQLKDKFTYEKDDERNTITIR